MTERTKNIFAVAVLVLVAAVVGISWQNGNGTQQNSGQEAIQQNEEQTVSQKTNLSVVQGNVISVTPEKLEITMDSTTTATEKSLEGPSRTVKLNPATVIDRVTLRKNNDGQMEALFLGQINIGELKRGRLVTVSYTLENGNVLDGVEKITVLLKENTLGL